MTKNILFILFLFFTFSCEDKKTFVWTPDLEQTIDKDLKQWVEKSPFEGRWNKPQTDKDVIVFDNRKQVFPFMGKFKNDVDDFINETYGDGDIYQEEVILYEDATFGESFAYAALLYEPEALFLKTFYSEMGDVLFSGQSAIHESYSASLSETLLFEDKDTHKAVIYWVSSNYQRYLCGFYQKGQLVYQFGFPCDINKTQKGLEKIKEINTTLGLNLTAWSDATIDDLAINNTPQSFWKNPFIGIYQGEYMLPEMKLKIKNTSYKKINSRITKQKGLDYQFVNDFNGNERTISFKRENTALTKLDFESQFKDTTYFTINDYEETKLFVIKEEVVNETIVMDLETYFKNDTYLHIQVSYPENDPQAKEEITDILTSLRIKRF